MADGGARTGHGNTVRAGAGHGNGACGPSDGRVGGWHRHVHVGGGRGWRGHRAGSPAWREEPAAGGGGSVWWTGRGGVMVPHRSARRVPPWPLHRLAGYGMYTPRAGRVQRGGADAAAAAVPADATSGQGQRGGADPPAGPPGTRRASHPPPPPPCGTAPKNGAPRPHRARPTRRSPPLPPPPAAAPHASSTAPLFVAHPRPTHPHPLPPTPVQLPTYSAPRHAPSRSRTTVAAAASSGTPARRRPPTPTTCRAPAGACGRRGRPHGARRPLPHRPCRR